MSGRNAAQVTAWRQRTKRKLVEAHGGKCVDCGFVGPAFVFDFDHRDPTEKEFHLAERSSYSYASQLAESMKCDLVCANCHRLRTHRQRCRGCEFCPETT